MIALTAFFVLSDFDQWYLTVTRNTAFQNIGFSAASLGFLVPIILFVVLYIWGAVRKSSRLTNAAHASAQAGLLGLGISTLYKVFTGRPGPYHILSNVNISQVFHFGILRGGAFQGWPSSHTAVAFAMSFALITLFPENPARLNGVSHSGRKWVRYTAFIYALYIGLGVSVSIHWFSDFAAGAILGTIIGITVGKAFLNKTNPIA